MKIKTAKKLIMSRMLYKNGILEYPNFQKTFKDFLILLTILLIILSEILIFLMIQQNKNITGESNETQRDR
jgi:hypothetical protein